jgi:cell division protein FtsN
MLFIPLFNKLYAVFFRHFAQDFVISQQIFEFKYNINKKTKMKKYTVLCAGLCLALAFTSCKSSESAYKKAYEKAKQYDTQTAQQQAAQPVETSTAVVAPVQTRPANDTRVTDNADNVSVRQERVSMVSGNGLKAFSVVVGSFGLVTNAEGLQQRLRDAGYDAQIVKNEDRNMYRVIAATFDNKADAARSRDQLRATYADAWLLSNQ